MASKTTSNSIAHRANGQVQPAAPAIAYVLFTFPVLSETVVVNELLALRGMGARLKILCWVTPEGKKYYTITDTQHAITSALMPLVCYIEGSRASRAEVLAATSRLLRRRGLASYALAYRQALHYRLVGDRRSFARFAVWADRLLREGFQHLHAHFATEAAAVAHTLSILSGLPFSFTAHAHDIYFTPQWLSEKMRAAKFVATVCEANRQHLLSTCPDVAPDKVHIIRPGVDVKVFSAQRAARNGVFRIVSVGRLTKTKGYVDLVAACQLLQERGIAFECDIAGEGHDRSEVEEAIAARGLGDRVRLLGALPREKVLPLLDSAHVFVLPCFVDPNTGDRDGMPLVLVEAMAMGLPVVSTPVSGIPELVRDKAGFIVPQRDVVSLADAMQMIYEMPEEQRVALARQGRQIVETEFNLEVEARKLVALMQDQRDATSRGRFR